MSETSDRRPPDARDGVAVVTDTTPYLPRELVHRWGIREVSLYVGWDGDLCPEDQYEDLDAFYTRLRESESLPATSQPSGGDEYQRVPLSGVVGSLVETLDVPVEGAVAQLDSAGSHYRAGTLPAAVEWMVANFITSGAFSPTA